MVTVSVSVPQQRPPKVVFPTPRFNYLGGGSPQPTCCTFGLLANSLQQSQEAWLLLRASLALALLCCYPYYHPIVVVFSVIVAVAVVSLLFIIINIIIIIIYYHFYYYYYLIITTHCLEGQTPSSLGRYSGRVLKPTRYQISKPALQAFVN